MYNDAFLYLWFYSDPFDYDEDDMLLDSDEEREEGHQSTKMRPMDVEIELEHTAMANARRSVCICAYVHSGCSKVFTN